MWMVDEVARTVKEMVLEGNIHNIVVFTVITSSSVLSVVGALRHIYTFINNIRHGQHVKLLPPPTFWTENDEPENALQNQSLILHDLDRFAYITCQYKDFGYKRKQRESACQQNRNSSQKCLKCNGGSWERHCVQGLCHECCQNIGGCQSGGHQGRPIAYIPWSRSEHMNDRVINLSHMELTVPVRSMSQSDRGSSLDQFYNVNLTNRGHMQLCELPPRLGFHCMDTCSLDLSHNCLSTLAEHLALVRGLINISLHHNLLTHIPFFFSSFHRLSFVDLRYNQITAFPVCLLDLSQLRRLYLDHNQLCHLPQDIDRLISLQTLSVGYNKITEICAALFNIIGLQTLCFRSNSELQSLPTSVRNLICLQKLDLSHCNLRQIPTTIGTCTFLRIFIISYNRLSHLPCEISQCYRLEQLDVRGNQLTYLPATLLFRQGQLAIQTLGNHFIEKKDVPRPWPALTGVISNGQKQPPSLWLLSRASVDRWGLDIGQLPLPIQEELSNASNCFHCGKKNITSSVGLVRFSQFNKKPLPQGSSGDDEYPFLYTFCSMHLQGCTQDTLEQRVDHLSQAL